MTPGQLMRFHRPRRIPVAWREAQSIVGMAAQRRRRPDDTSSVWIAPLIVQVDPWGGVAVFCDVRELALLIHGPRAWLAFRGHLIGAITVGRA